MKRPAQRAHLRVIASGDEREGLLRVCEDVGGNRWPERYTDGKWLPCDWPDDDPHEGLVIEQ